MALKIEKDDGETPVIEIENDSTAESLENKNDNNSVIKTEEQDTTNNVEQQTEQEDSETKIEIKEKKEIKMNVTNEENKTPDTNLNGALNLFGFGSAFNANHTVATEVTEEQTETVTEENVDINELVAGMLAIKITSTDNCRKKVIESLAEFDRILVLNHGALGNDKQLQTKLMVHGLMLNEDKSIKELKVPALALLICKVPLWDIAELFNASKEKETEGERETLLKEYLETNNITIVDYKHAVEKAMLGVESVEVTNSVDVDYSKMSDEEKQEHANRLAGYRSSSDDDGLFTVKNVAMGVGAIVAIGALVYAGNCYFNGCYDDTVIIED